MEHIKSISELITVLEGIKAKEGDIAVCYSTKDEYWGSTEDYLSLGYNLRVTDHAQPDGPKCGYSVKAVQFG